MRQLVTRLAAAIAALLPVAALAGPAVTPLVSTAWLADNVTADGLVVIDVRAAAAFAAGHVPGAQQTDYPADWQITRDGVPWSLRDVLELEALIGGLGIGTDTSVVIIPAGTGSTELGAATWTYWVFKYLGHDAVAILDGGWSAWQGEGRAVETGSGTAPASATFVAELRPEIYASTADVAASLGTATVIVDARPADQYRGTAVTSLVVRSGHIPGAINIDNARFYDPVLNRFKPTAALEAELPPELADRSAAVISYCNTGHWGSIDWFVLHELLGFANVRLYEGSMAEWSRDPSLLMEISPEVGPPPSQPGIPPP